MQANIKMNISMPSGENRRLQAYVEKEVLRQTYDRLKEILPLIEKNIRQLIHHMFEQSPEIYQLLHSRIRYDLGVLPDEMESVMKQIPDIIADSLRVNIIKRQNIVLTVSMVPAYFVDIANIKEGTFIQTFTKKEPKEIHWLDWLLTKGNEIIISEYRVLYKHTSASRTGEAIMVELQSGMYNRTFGSSGFRIPPEFAGTIENNFITRALDGIDEIIFRQIKTLIG